MKTTTQLLTCKIHRYHSGIYVQLSHVINYDKFVIQPRIKFTFSWSWTALNLFHFLWIDAPMWISFCHFECCAFKFWRIVFLLSLAKLSRYMYKYLKWTSSYMYSSCLQYKNNYLLQYIGEEINYAMGVNIHWQFQKPTAIYTQGPCVYWHLFWIVISCF